MAHMIVPKNTHLPILATIDQYAPRRWKRTSNPKSRYMMACPLPGHDDREHSDGSGSFAVNDEETLFICFGCEGSGNGYQLHQLLSGGEVFFRPTRQPRQTDNPRQPDTSPATHPQKEHPSLQGANIRDVAVAKGLDEDYLKHDLSWEDSDWYGTPAIKIPYPDETNGDVQVRYRVGIDSGDRFRWESGSKARPYGLWDLPSIKERNFCILVEGETDYATLDYHGFPVLAVPGVKSIKGPALVKYLDGIERIYLWQEPDDGGQFFINLVSRHRRDVLVITPPAGVKDATELADEVGGGFADLMHELLDTAQLPQSAFAQTQIRTSFLYPKKSIRSNFGLSVKDYLPRQRNELVEAYRSGALGQNNTIKATRIAGCGLNYLFKRCQNTGEVMAKPERCGDPNCPKCAVWLVQQFLDGKATVLEQHLNDPTVYITHLFSQRLHTENGPMAEDFKQIYKQIRKIVTHLSDSFGADRRIARDHLYGIRAQIEGDAAHFELVLMGEREPGDLDFLQDFFRRQTGVDSQIREIRCHGLGHANKVFASIMAMRVEWDQVSSYLAWRAGIKGAKIIQGKGALYKVSGGAKGRVRTLEEQANHDECPICGNCIPVAIPGLHSIANTSVRTKKSEWTGKIYLEPVEDA